MTTVLESAKAVVTLVGAVTTALLAVLDDAALDANEVGAFVAAVITAVATYYVKNRGGAAPSAGGA